MLISFNSTSHAIRAERMLIENGINVTVMPIPAKIRAGCGIALNIDDIKTVKTILNEAQIEFEVHKND
ncbi:MAG: DUF3343 domain-containing protein [Firmicutes bacterium]|nr:DUF3343 domain-containing protein [Bacillota bacterium]